MLGLLGAAGFPTTSWQSTSVPRVLVGMFASVLADSRERVRRLRATTAHGVVASEEVVVDRDQYLLARRVERVPQTVALAALAGAVDGDLVAVHGAGLFMFVGASTTPADGTYVITAVGSPGGQWISALALYMGAANGLATLDGAQRGAQSFPWSTVAAAAASNSNADGTTSTSFVDAAGLSITLPKCRAGDRIAIDFELTSGDASAAAGSSRVVVAEAGSASFAPVAHSSRYFATDGAHRSGQRLYAVANAGTAAIEVQIQSASGALFPLDGASARTLRGVVMRP
jgi:hypothetical protein